MIHKIIFRRLPAGFYLLPFSALLFVLTHYSYHAKELLVCWLLFCSFFALLALMFLGAVLACYAGQYLMQWVRVANTVIPELVACLAEFSQEPISGPRLLVADPSACVDVLDAHSDLLIEHTTRDGVRN